jgi:anti-anti-sigma regulatory factor
VHYSIKNDSDALRVTMEGPFTFQDSHSFHMMMHSIKEFLDAAEVRLNMARLESIDAMALSMLLLAFDIFKKQRMPLVFEQPQGQVHDALNQAARHNALNIAAINENYPAA